MESTGEQGDFLHDIELGEHVFYIYRGRHIASDLLCCSESPEIMDREVWEGIEGVETG